MPSGNKMPITTHSWHRAKTAILVPELDRYYLAVPRHGNKEAEVRVYSVSP
jgi:hypothetical protein